MNYLIQILVKMSVGIIIKLFFAILFSLIKLPFRLFKKETIINAKLIKIKDGDTFSFELNNGEKINLRLFGIDTPEKFNSNKLDKDLQKQNGIFNRLLGLGVTKEEMIEVGELSTNFAKKLLTENSFYNVKIIDKDKYDRYVGIVYFNEETPSEMITSDNYNIEIIKQGYAIAYTSYITDDIVKFKYNYHNFISRMTNKGLWKTNKNIMNNL